MLVPSSVIVAEVLPIYALNTPHPGANTSTEAPKLLTPPLVSVLSIPPTVIAEAVEAGESWDAS